MGRLVATIARKTKTLHNLLDKKPYLLRYHQPDFTLLDHYRHLYQLAAIYQALEKKLMDANFLQTLPKEFHYLLHRSAEIKKDLAFLDTFVSFSDKKTLLHSTKAYVQFIDGLAVNTEDNNSILLAHFLARILGDLFGGQSLRKHVKNLYDKKKVAANDLTTGVHFYHFQTNTVLKDFSLWLDKEYAGEEINKIAEWANDAFERHIALFDELENSRSRAMTENVYRFFGCFAMNRKTALATALTVAAGTALTVYGLTS